MRIHAPKELQTGPRVSIVIPHYNYSAYLGDAVGSALSQSGLDLEIVIVDDCSRPEEAEIANRIAASDPRIRYIEHVQNLGHIRTYNEGLAQATGAYVVLLSADDVLTKDSLTRAVALLEAHPEVGFVYGPVKSFEDILPEAGRSAMWWQIWSGDEWIARVARRGRNMIVNPEVVMRRSVYEAIGGYDVEFPHAADMLLWLRAAADSGVGFVGGSIQAGYRQHGQNMHATRFAGALDDMRQVRGVYEVFFGQQPDEYVELAEAAARAVAREATLRSALLAGQNAPAPVVDALRRFAVETSPRVRCTPLWQWAALAGCKRNGVDALVGAVERTRWRMRSRRHAAIGF